MNFFRSKIHLFLTLILFGQFSSFAQDLRQKAEENPLSTVLYLLSTTEKDSKKDEKACLAKSFSKVNKFEESRKAAELFDDGGYAEDELIAVVNNLIENDNLKEAGDFASYLVKRFEDDDTDFKKLWEPLIVLNRETEAVKIADRFGDSEKIDAYFAMAEAYLKLKNSRKALELVEKISPLVEESGQSEDKAGISLLYAKLGAETRALGFARSALKNVVWKTGNLERDDIWIVRDVFQAYIVLGKYDSAFEILDRQEKRAEPDGLIQIAKGYLEKGDRGKAVELLERSFSRLSPKVYGDSFDLGDLAEIYLELGAPEKAEKIVESLSGSDYMQQKQWLNIADFYVRKKNDSKALLILNLALDRTKKIDTSEAENGRLWTSKKWNQAQYQSQIARRLIDMRSNKKALEIISQLKKPYLRASALTEFVSANKKRISAAKLSSHLEEALSLLRNGEEEIFDSNKYDVYAIVARNFAEIGMPEKANDVFAEVLSKDKEMVEKGLDDYLLVAMCKIGVDFEKSKIEPNENLRNSLRQIIKNWENDEY